MPKPKAATLTPLPETLSAALPKLCAILADEEQAKAKHGKLQGREQALSYVTEGRSGRATDVYLADKEAYRQIGDQVEAAEFAWEDVERSLVTLVEELAGPLEEFCQGEASRMMGEIEAFLDSYRVKGETRGSFLSYPGKIRLWQNRTAMIYQPGQACQVTAGKLIAFLEDQSKTIPQAR